MARSSARRGRGAIAARAGALVHWFPTPDHDGSHIPLRRPPFGMGFVRADSRPALEHEVGSAVHSLDAACDPSIHRPLRVRDPSAPTSCLPAPPRLRQGVLEQLVSSGSRSGTRLEEDGAQGVLPRELISAENFVRAYAAPPSRSTCIGAQGRAPDGPVTAGSSRWPRSGYPSWWTPAAAGRSFRGGRRGDGVEWNRELAPGFASS
jgi:hypothetical protein